MVFTSINSELQGLGVQQLHFALPDDSSLEGEALLKVQKQFQSFAELLQSDASADSIDKEANALTALGVTNVVVGVSSDISDDKLVKVQKVALGAFNELGFKISGFSGSAEAPKSEEKEVKKEVEEKAVEESDSDSDSEEVKEVAEVKVEENNDSDSDSDSDSSDEEENKTKAKPVAVVEKKEESSDSDSDSDSSSDEEKTETPAKMEVETPQPKPKKKPATKRKPNQPFRRVKSSGKSHSSNAWDANQHGEHGQEAMEKLGRYQGKDFIKAKNKRKRCNRSGRGQISMDVHSIDLTKRRKLNPSE